MIEYIDNYQQTEGHIWLMIILQIVTGEDSNDVTYIHQNQEARYRHIACDDKQDPVTTNNMPANMTTKEPKAL